jgi:hypothetical protein
MDAALMPAASASHTVNPHFASYLLNTLISAIILTLVSVACVKKSPIN